MTDTPAPALIGDTSSNPAGTPPAGSPAVESVIGAQAPAGVTFTEVNADWLAPLLPEGMAVNETQSASLVRLVNEAKGDSTALVKGLLSEYANQTKAAIEAADAEYVATMEKWQTEIKTDAELGGAKLEGSLAAANELMAKFGSKELVDLFRATGAGNSIHMLRFLTKMSAALPREGAPVSGSPAAQPKSLAERLFS